jgi:hypothetical protein
VNARSTTSGRFGRERLGDLTWRVGYYSALALSLAVFRPFLPQAYAPRAG